MSERGRLCLESGACFEGLLIGSPLDSCHAWGEVVFNTCMTGYQEIMSDPSYAGQIVVLTYPMIGNYGCRESFMESRRLHCRALIVRELSTASSHSRRDNTVDQELRRHGIPGLTGIDTRALTRHIRDRGALRGILAPCGSMTERDQVALSRTSPTIDMQDLVADVSQTDEWTRWSEPLPREHEGTSQPSRHDGLRIVCVDLGIKRNQLRALATRGAEIIVVRHDATVDMVMSHRPDGVLISNGPGDPARLEGQVRLVQSLLDRHIPMLGICLGHQILGRAIGATTSKLHFGHHGGNHPVRDERNGSVYVTAQNHEFQVDAAHIPAGSGWFVSERNLNDGSVEGLRHVDLPAFGVQYHPEGAPGPQDRACVFDEFMEMAAGGRSGMGLSPRRIEVASIRGSFHPKPRLVLVIGSGPVVIGQAAEFDYAGTQACRSLREEGVRVILANSNPATIMTDDDSADAVYIEPLTVPVLTRIIETERPDGLLATLGGQTALNLAVGLGESGVLERCGVRVLGTSLDAIQIAEDRERFKTLLAEIGQPAPESQTVQSLREARTFLSQVGLPVVVRPAFTLGGTGGGLCETEEQFLQVVASGLAASPISQVLIEKSVAGWREVEYEVMRDGAGACITICNMENIDPMGVHTGDSIVVAPTQTLTDREHQQLRTAALRIIEALRIEGGCNVQFALAPDSHDYFVIEVNPRVSRSSALASKATGYPIARVAAKVALGMRLDEIPNAVTGKTCAAFEPALDYCAIKIPRWPFDKFQGADRRLGTQMKSTGEVMAIERTFEAALSKALRSLEQAEPLDADLHDPVLVSVANDHRIFALQHWLRSGVSPQELSIQSGISRWFLDRLQRLVELESELTRQPINASLLTHAKRSGIGDDRIAELTGSSRDAIRKLRRQYHLQPAYKSVDTCAAEFAALTPYYYSTFEDEDESVPSNGQAVVVIGSGPIRIGQGIEFDYCSVQAAQSLVDQGKQAIMINSNPETVSTDFDCSTRLYFEPLDVESVAAVIESESAHGVIVQVGGQTAINLAAMLTEMGVLILGTGVKGIDLAEDRSLFGGFLQSLGILQPPGTATVDQDEAVTIAEGVGYPVVVRPSFVLGGRGMEIVYDRPQLERYVQSAVAALPHDGDRRRGTVLVDKYLVGTEVDVDAVADGATVVIPGLMEHIEGAGIHSGDSMATYPPVSLSGELKDEITQATIRITRALGVRGLCNIQFVVHQGRHYVIEVNPRASRTVPFISKVTGIPLVDLATRVACGGLLSDLGYESGLVPDRPLFAVKAPVFSTVKLDRVDSALGPEMKSTGEVMGVDLDFVTALEKAFLASLGRVPRSGGTLLCSIADPDKLRSLPLMHRLHNLGFSFYATRGTAAALQAAGLPAMPAGRIDHDRPSVLDVIEEGRVSLVINTVSRSATDWEGNRAAQKPVSAAGQTIRDGYRIREAADRHHIPCCTSLDTASALIDAIARDNGNQEFEVASVAEYRGGLVRQRGGVLAAGEARS